MRNRWSRMWPALTAVAVVASVAGGVASASAATAGATPAAASGTHRVVAYYQTQYVTNPDGSRTYVSPLPLRGIATDVEVAAIHLNADHTVHVNDNLPSDPMFVPMWRDVRSLQRSGVHVTAMLGGAGVGSFANLHADFPTFYGLLSRFLRTYQLDGIDLDIEEPFSLADTEHLIDTLRSDFGPDFIIAMSPVAADLSGKSMFSGGFDYATLNRQEGRRIDWYNAQFYCGWGSLSSTKDYDAVIRHGFAPDQVVAGTVTNPANCGGYVEPSQLAATIAALSAKYSDFGGVAGWEYFNSLGPDPDNPASWYAAAATAMAG